jgi:hypothetical protein
MCNPKMISGLTLATPLKMSKLRHCGRFILTENNFLSVVQSNNGPLSPNKSKSIILLLFNYLQLNI